MGNSARVWVIIGAIMVLIDSFCRVNLVFLENKIDQLVATCEKEGGKAIVDRGGFIVTTSFEYECKQ